MTVKAVESWQNRVNEQIQAERRSGGLCGLSLVRLLLRLVAQQFAVMHDGHQEKDSEEGAHHQEDYEEFGHMPTFAQLLSHIASCRSVILLTLACAWQGSTGR